MPVEITPTTPADVTEFFPKAQLWRIRALTARLDGKIIGIGGIATLPDGTMAAFLECEEEWARKYPLTLHKTALRVLADARLRGVRKLVAMSDDRRDAARRWLQRLGFEASTVLDGKQFYL